jgi:hypothetical protein
VLKEHFLIKIVHYSGGDIDVGSLNGTGGSFGMNKKADT